MPVLAFAGDTSTKTSSYGNNQSTNAQNGNDTQMRSDNSKAETLWRELDTNNDGTVSRTEFNAYHGNMKLNGVSVNTPYDRIATGGEMNASDLIGTEVRNRKSQDLGESRIS